MPRARRTRRAPRTTYTRRRRVARKRTYAKRKRVYRQQLKVQKNRFPGFAEVFYTKLTYFENNYKLALGNLDKLNRYAFRLNSPYDPVMATFNKSANYFDDYMAHYKYCRVMGAKITVKFSNDVTNNRQMQMCLIPNAYNTPYTDMDEIATQIRKRMSTFSNGVALPRVVKMYLPIHTIFGISKQQYTSQLPGPDYDVQNLGIGGYSDVAKSAQVDLWYAKVDENGSFPTQVIATVKINFYCKFYVRIPSKPLGGDIGDEELDIGEVHQPGSGIMSLGDIQGPDLNTFPVNP